MTKEPREKEPLSRRFGHVGAGLAIGGVTLGTFYTMFSVAAGVVAGVVMSDSTESLDDYFNRKSQRELTGISVNACYYTEGYETAVTATTAPGTRFGQTVRYLLPFIDANKQEVLEIETHIPRFRRVDCGVAKEGLEFSGTKARQALIDAYDAVTNSPAYEAELKRLKKIGANNIWTGNNILTGREEVEITYEPAYGKPGLRME